MEKNISHSMSLNQSLIFKILCLVFCIVIFNSLSLKAEENSDIIDRAKNRTYIGGHEESDLKVLPESYFEKNKKNKLDEADEGF